MAWNGSDKEKAKAKGAIERSEIAERSAGLREQRRGKFRSSTSTHNFNYKALLAGLIVVVGGGLAAWFFTGERGESGERGGSGEIKASRIAEVKPQIATNVVEAEAPAVAKKDVRMERGVEVVAVSARTNQSGVVVEKLTLADGRKIEKVIRPKPIFDNVSDQMIALVLSAEPGQSMAPLPSLGNIDQEFAKSLLSPIRIDEEDSEEVKKVKLDVKEARTYLAEEVKNGRTVAECLQDYREQMEDVADRHAMAAQEMNKMRTNGATDEEIQTFRSRINEIFREKGIPELPDNHNKARPGKQKE